MRKQPGERITRRRSQPRSAGAIRLSSHLTELACAAVADPVDITKPVESTRPTSSRMMRGGEAMVTDMLLAACRDASEHRV